MNYSWGNPDIGIGATGGGAITFPGGVLILGGSTGAGNTGAVLQQQAANTMAGLVPIVLIGLVAFLAFRK